MAEYTLVSTVSHLIPDLLRDICWISPYPGPCNPPCLPAYLRLPATACLQVGHGGQLTGRFKRWLRVVDRGGSSWQEVLRRYLLLTRNSMLIHEDDLADSSSAAASHSLCDDMVAVQVWGGEAGQGPA